MRLNNSLAYGVAALLMAATPVFAQSTSAGTDAKPQVNGSKAPTGSVASTAEAQKQRTQGVPAGGDFNPPQYGAAQKQHTQGVPAGGAFNAPQYGTDQAGIRK